MSQDRFFGHVDNKGFKSDSKVSLFTPRLWQFFLTQKGSSESWADLPFNIFKSNHEELDMICVDSRMFIIHEATQLVLSGFIVDTNGGGKHLATHMVTVLEGCDHDDSKRKCFIYFSDEYAFIITDGKIFEESLLTSLDFPNEKASQVLRKLLYSFAEKTNVFVYRGYKIG